jgi:hypothetical protein
MPYKPSEIEKMLLSKLKCQNKERDHKWFIITIDGLPTIRTKLSHNNKDVGDKLENRIMKQLHVRKKFFHELMDCTKYLIDYEKQVREDPYPPFTELFL